MTSTRRRGAKSKTAIVRVPAQFIARRLKRGLLATAGVASLVLGGFIYHSFDRPLTNVMISGDFQYLHKHELTELLRDHLQVGFLSVDLKGLQREIEGHPWVDQVSIWRQWPTTLQVDVIEEIPIARWGDSGFLNHRGKQLDNPSDIRLETLPVLQSNSATSEKMMGHYQRFNQQLAATGLRIVSLEYDVAGAWQLQTTANFRLFLGRDQLLPKLRRFGQVWTSGLSAQSSLIENVDLRYPNGFAVAWKDQTASAQQPAVISVTASDRRG
jgi:cell division protein FtsQ|tara:strand:- start:703 stop:1512 length:810 start_codon:yes stop_codon:yes gene_type:complete